MRVLHIHSGNLYGGVETLLTTLARHRDFCPSMESHYAICFEGRLSEELNGAGAPVHLLGKTHISQPLSVVRARRALNNLLRLETFDLAVFHSTWSQSLFGPIIQSANLPLVFWLHNPTNGKHWLDRWGSRTTPDLVLCNSKFTANSVNNLFPEVRSEVLYAPVASANESHSKRDCTALRAELQTPEDAVVIIQASRLEEWKGQAVLMDALGRLKDLPGWMCWQVGGAQRPSEIEFLDGLKRKTEQLGIAERVRFAGQRSDVESLLTAADIYCQPNTGAEPFGLTFIEALAARLPVLTTATGGALEIVNEECGLLVPPDHALALAEALRRLILDRTLRARLGNAGPARARALCDVKTQMQQLYEHFSSVSRRRPENGSASRAGENPSRRKAAVQLRNIVASLIPPRTRGRLIKLEISLKESSISSSLARYFAPYLIKSYIARPHEIDIEVTSACDADCIMCPRNAMRRKVGPMDLNLFKKIVDEAVALGVQELHLNGYGEISVLRNYQEYISYIRQKSRSIKININTNGMRMSEEMSRFYVASRVNNLNVTIDGATPATFESIRRHLKLDVVEGNVKRLIQIRDQLHKKHPLVTVHMIGMPQNIHEAEVFLEKWKGVADSVGISGLMSRIGSVAFAKIDNPKWNQTPCFLLWRQMPILSDGTVAMCCDDWDGKGAQGNLNRQTIKEIWTSRKRDGLRKVHLSGKAAKIPLCANCKQPRKGPAWFGSGNTQIELPSSNGRKHE